MYSAYQPKISEALQPVYEVITQNDRVVAGRALSAVQKRNARGLELLRARNHTLKLRVHLGITVKLVQIALFEGFKILWFMPKISASLRQGAKSFAHSSR